MELYLNELAPWERKKEYFHTIQIGRNIETQSNILKKGFENQIKSQFASTNAVICSQERIQEQIENGFQDISIGLDRVNSGIDSLKSSFEWGISEVVWQIEQNTKVLKEILEVLITPLDTQAKERKKRAEEAFANGWYDDAEDEFLESEKLNKYDFSIHISLGIIYLFHLINKEKAFEYFKKAAKYASPKSNYYTSFSLLYASLIKRDFGKIEEAEILTSEAVEISPNFIEAKYQNSLLNALLNRPEKSIPQLKEAIASDIFYCEKICSESGFDNIRHDIDIMFDGLREETRKKAHNEFSNNQNFLRNIFKFVDDYKLLTDLDVEFEHTEYSNNIHRIKDLLSRNSLRDYWEVMNICTQNVRLAETIKLDIKTSIDKNISSLEKELTTCLNKGILDFHKKSFVNIFKKNPLKNAEQESIVIGKKMLKIREHLRNFEEIAR